MQFVVSATLATHIDLKAIDRNHLWILPSSNGLQGWEF